MKLITYIAVVFHILLVLGAFFGWFNDSFHGTYYSDRQGLDLHALYNAGKDFREGEPIYHPPPYSDGYTPFRYLPVTALVGIPLSFIPFEWAYVLWFILIEAVMLLQIFHLRKFLRNDDDFRIALCMYFLFTPYYVELYMGQYSMIQAMFILFFFTNLYAGREDDAFTYWIASTLWKVNTLLAVPVLIKFRKLYPVWLSIGLTAGSLIIYSIFIPANIRFFFWINFRTPAIYQEGNIGLMMLWNELVIHVFHQGIFNHIWDNYDLTLLGNYIYLALPVIILLCCFLALFKAQKGKFADLAALWITAYFLLYIDVWEHHYLMLLPILVLQYLRKRWPLILYCFIFIAVPTTFSLFSEIPVIYLPSSTDGTPIWMILLHHATKPLATLVFFIALMRHILIAKPVITGQNTGDRSVDNV